MLCGLSLLLGCRSETKRISRYAVHGIDVSHYQKKIDWPVVAGQEIQFAFIKATEGRSFKDSTFIYNWSSCKEVGVLRGAYHFFHPTIPVNAQVKNFIKTVQLQPGDLPPVLDVEVANRKKPEEVRAAVHKWLRLVEQHYKVKPILYTYSDFYDKYLCDHFEDYPLWIARYTYEKPLLKNDRQWDFWQYGNRGRLEGIEGHVDFNVFSGSRRELEQLCF